MGTSSTLPKWKVDKIKKKQEEKYLETEHAVLSKFDDPVFQRQKILIGLEDDKKIFDSIKRKALENKFVAKKKNIRRIPRDMPEKELNEYYQAIEEEMALGNDQLNEYDGDEE